jgi:hypothetical protein
MGYVDTSRAGVTELRVHGVSGTPPEAMLCHPHARRVAGDSDAGFYRRVWESPATSQDRTPEGPSDGVHRMEGYYWGRLTSGGWSRALYLLLLPFLLLNVGSFMTPRSPLRENGGWKWVRIAAEALQRLLALSLTLTMTLTIVEVAVDMAGWQCGRAAATCAGGSLVAVPDWPWLRQTGPRLAVTGVAPLAVVLLLWWLANSTWQRAEAVLPPHAPADEDSWVSPLEGRKFWNGSDAVARLRSYHITAALTVVGLAVTTALLGPSSHTPGKPTNSSPAVLWSGHTWADHRLPALIAVVLLALLFASILGVVLPATAIREMPPIGMHTPARRWFRDWRRLLPAATLLLVITAGLVVASAGAAALPVGRGPSTLPWLTLTITFVFWSQSCLVILLAALTAVQAWSGRGTGRVATGDATAVGTAVGTIVTRPAWRGMALPAFALLGWMVGSGFSSALALRVAAIVGNPVPEVCDRMRTCEAITGRANPTQAKRILVPVGYFWSSAAAVPVLCIAVVMAGALAVHVLRTAKRLQEQVADGYDLPWPLPAGGDPEQEESSAQLRERVPAVARSWAIGLAPDDARSLAGWVFAATALVLAAGAAGYLRDQSWVIENGAAAALLGIGNVVMTLAVAGLVYVGRQTYTSPRFRRTVGILWDVGTFWPRATHPLAPPSYGERAIPDLLHRIQPLAGCGPEPASAADVPGAVRDVVVLSCHSQGCVIGAAAVAASRYDVLQRTALFTYGDPLRRIYTRFFPAYFGVAQLERLGRLLTEHPPPAGSPPPVVPPPPTTSAQRAAWPWRNLQRRSDFIGGFLFTELSRTRPGDVDVLLIDPTFWRDWGDSAWPQPLAHSDYPSDPLFPVVLRDVVRLRRDRPFRWHAR